MNKSPDLSVVMSVYNGQEYLEESIESILRQSYGNFEFIIINDGSTDNTGKIITNCAAKDKRIIVVYQQNIGLTRSLNKGIKRAKGKYIARHDADDLSLPKRFEAQITFLKNNPKIVLCGTWFQEINENTGFITRRYPLDDATLRKHLKYVNYFCHPSVMFSKKAFTNAGGYDESFKTAQDFELWIRMAREGKISNLPEVLVKKRIGFGTTVSWEKRKEKTQVVKDVISKHFESWRDIEVGKFLRYYLPLMVYGYIPIPLLKIIRKIRYT